MIHGTLRKRVGPDDSVFSFAFAVALFAVVFLMMAGVASAQDGDDPDKSEPKTAKIGKPAPDFTLTDLDGKEHTLSEYHGKVVVLEWFNPECPYVKDQHNGKREGAPLRDMGNQAVKDGVVWLAINSGAKGEQGTGVEKNKRYRKEYKMEYPVLLDEDGTVGRLYVAKRTPQMCVIDKKGVLRYVGAIDNAPFGKIGTDPRHPAGKDKTKKDFVNYVEQALDEIEAEEDVTTSKTTPYGCSIKYASKSSGEGGKKK